MKAMVRYEYGLPDEVLAFQEIDKPMVNDDEVLVRVQAIGLHAGDWLTLRGIPYLMRMALGLFKPKSIGVGTDVAGYVEAVGKNVTRFQPGDEVFGWSKGACAEYATTQEDKLVRKPAGITFEQAAAIPTSAAAALYGLRKTGQIAAGQKVLIIGASGGVGTFAVQIAKSFGAEVTGVCSTRNLEMVRSIGADHVSDYTQEDFTQSGEHYDLILDIAGNRPLSESRRALTPDGTLVLAGGKGGRWLYGLDRTIKAAMVSPFIRQNLRGYVSLPAHEDLVALKELVESGKVTPVIDRTYSLSETPAAMGYLGEGHTQGKVVITM
ncbi:MAG: NAD(P)-dependent alcohol dehydrogenase [Caldilineaceae bacterium]